MGMSLETGTKGCSMRTKAGTGGRELGALVFTAACRERMQQGREQKEGQRPDILDVSSKPLSKQCGVCTLAARWGESAQKSPPRGKGWE